MSQTPDRKEGVINDSLRAAPYQRKRGVGLTATLTTAEYFPEAFDIYWYEKLNANICIFCIFGTEHGTECCE